MRHNADESPSTTQGARHRHVLGEDDPARVKAELDRLAAAERAERDRILHSRGGDR